MKVRIAFTLALALAVAAGPGEAEIADYVATSRPLTRSEIVGTTAHEADRIVVADYVGEHLSYRDAVTGRGGRLPYQVNFRPRRWLKDSAPDGAELSVCWWPPAGAQMRRPFYVSPDGPAQPPFAGQTFVLFLQKGSPGGSEPTCSLSTIAQGPPWLTHALSPWTQALETEVRLAVANQSLEALAALAPRVVVGTVEVDAVNPRNPGPPQAYVRVTRALKGPRDPSRIAVDFVDPRVAAPNKSPQLFFLRPVAGGVYEPVELIAGVREVRDDRVPAWDLSVDELAKRVGKK